MTQKGDGDAVEGKMFLLKSLLSSRKSKLGRLSGNCFSSCAVFAFLRCIYDSLYCIMVLLHSLIYQASVLSVVECLLYATLEAHYIFLLTIILLSSLSVARVNVQDVCSWPACVYSGSSERRQKQFPQLINKLEESDTEET